MKAAGSLSLPKPAARVARALLARLAERWRAPGLRTVEITIRPSLRRTLGRFSARANRIEVSPRALSPRLLPEVLAHEAAHAALRRAAAGVRPHGPEWRRLMSVAGFDRVRAVRWQCRQSLGTEGQPHTIVSAKRALSSTVYDHWCPVCQASRPSHRPVKAWRCAGCVAAGLPGRLEITRRPARTPR